MKTFINIIVILAALLIAVSIYPVVAQFFNLDVYKDIRYSNGEWFPTTSVNWLVCVIWYVLTLVGVELAKQR